MLRVAVLPELILVSAASLNLTPQVSLAQIVLSASPHYAWRCSPTRTIFMVLVPPALPNGSPMLSTM